jgi:hypothetical protein
VHGGVGSRGGGRFAVGWLRDNQVVSFDFAAATLMSQAANANRAMGSGFGFRLRPPQMVFGGLG